MVSCARAGGAAAARGGVYGLLRGRLAAPTTVTPPKPVGPVLDARTVEEYESKIEFLLRELKQHESTPR